MDKVLSQVVEILQAYPKLEKKCENMRKSMLKNEFEKTFWQRKCKYYAPNKMEEHYKELDEELIKAGLMINKNL